MKTFRMIGIAMLAVIMCVNFTACSEDDDNSPTNHPTNANKLGSVMIYDIENNKKELNDIIKFEYDKNGNVVKVYEQYGNNSDEIDITEYIWDSNKSITSYWENDEYIKYTLTNNQITDILSHEYVWYVWMEERELDEDFYRCTYDKDGNLIEILFKDNEEDDYELVNEQTWNNGQLSMAKDYDYERVITLHYDNQTCKNFFPLLADYIANNEFSDDYIFMAQPELLGVRTSKLPSKIIDGSCIISFDYELNAYGNVTSCTVNKFYSNDNLSYDYLYEFVWE